MRSNNANYLGAEGMGIPASARREIDKIFNEEGEKFLCDLCKKIKEKHGGHGPTHRGSFHCRSGSIASGGNVAHCTCDTCF